ncbi:MAG: 3'-5' exonuclease [Azospirillum sp.]|nr:3'-5' exonuclease [Azospirillum sp.]
MFTELSKRLKGHRLSDPAFQFLLEPDRSGEKISLHCKASSFDVARAELRSVAAIPILGQRVQTSRRLVIKLAPDQPQDQAVRQLLTFIGCRPLVGYYLDFSVSLIDRLALPLIGIPLPNRRIEVSSIYYDRRINVFSNQKVDLRLNSMLQDLGLPERGPADAFSDALTAALIYLKLKGLEDD